MTASTINGELTPFEMQVLQAMSQEIADWSDYSDEHLWAPHIHLSGVKMFGKVWAGGHTPGNYPLLNKFLGRLRSKGLVERHDTKKWSLTEAGNILLGTPTDVCLYQTSK